MKNDIVLELRNISKSYRKGKKHQANAVKASRNVSLTIKKQHILSLVGESGSGKSTLAKIITNVEKPDSGQIYFEHKLVNNLYRRQLKKYRGHVQMIFQDPFASTNPLNTVKYILSRPLINYLHVPKSEVDQQIKALLKIVDLTPVDDFMNKLPYELSGGQLQRVGIARALASKPDLIIADEPVSMLDVSIRANILKLLDKLRRKQGVSLLYITHDLVSARALADEIMVLYRGKVVEYGPSSEITTNPKHPYTDLLLNSIANPWRKNDSRVDMKEMNNSETPDHGCIFRNRCPFAKKACVEASPKLVPIAENHLAACFLHSHDRETDG
ncbi:MAG: ATP-binding cassette domain-containing protein [Sporolactobacillus sp.]|nr:ATP-binding cassette domain-containing protein [Sporolactobacillus sp.]